MSAVIAWYRVGNLATIKISIQPGRMKPLLALAKFPNNGMYRPDTYHVPFALPLTVPNITHTSEDPIVIYMCYSYEVMYFFVPESTIQVMKRSDAYECYLPIHYPTSNTANYNFLFGFPEKNCVTLDGMTATFKELDVNIKDFLSAFNLTY